MEKYRLNHFANVGPSKLRDHSARLGKPLEPVAGSEKSLHMERRIPGRTAGNVRFDLLNVLDGS